MKKIILIVFMFITLCLGIFSVAYVKYGILNKPEPVDTVYCGIDDSLGDTLISDTLLDGTHI